jgi:glycosyltransferase involved in cell wall biosynthesis
MPQLPKITVVTPSYNQAMFLERTILSVITQNYPNIEYIIMDGGSTDSSVEIISKYSKHITHWQSAPDRGQADAIASGFEMATGDILCWINSDDMLMPGALRYVANRFMQNPQHQWLVGTVVVVDEDDNILGCATAFPFWTSRIMLASGQGTAQQAVFWRKELYKQVGGINRDRQFCLDYELFVKFVALRRPMWTVERLGVFRQHPESKTFKLDEVRACEELLIRQAHKRYIPFVESICYRLMKKAWNWTSLYIPFLSGKLPIPELKE